MSALRSCCFTGYRPEKFPFPLRPGHPLYNAFENKLTDAIFTLASDGFVRFYSGAAQGFDLLAAELVLLGRSSHRLPIQLYCAVPFRGQADGWAPAWKKRYDAVLAQADHVEFLSDAYFQGCYQRRNRFMVDNSQTVLTYFDGKPGGTANTLSYARRTGTPVINLADFDMDACLEDIPVQFEIVL